jgi:tetratricopeptide (TPR) repeat protein
MPIRISRCAVSVVIAVVVLLAGCGPGAGVRPEEGVGPKGPDALVADADAAFQRGDLPAAAAEYRRAAEASDDEAVAEQATRFAFDNLQLKEGARSADRWLAVNPTSEQAQRYAGLIALRLHRLDRAEAEFAKLLSTVYISPAAGFLALVQGTAEEGTPTDVTELFRRLAARYPTVGEGQYALGTAALRGENFALAVDSARRATELAKYWVPAKLLLARALIASGKESEGLAMARDLVMAPDSDPGTQIEYALLLAGTGHDEEARAILTPYATGRAVIPGALRTLGALDLDAGQLDAANRRFEDLLSTGAQTYDALYFLGLVAERRKNTDQAQRFYSKVEGGGFALASQQRVAWMKAQASGLEAGLRYLEVFGEGHPQMGPELVGARAGLASSMKDEKRSLAILDAGLKVYPDSADLRMARVFLYERTGKADAAVRELRAMLEERPGDAVVQNALGYTLADHGRQLEEAHSLVASALAQAPDSAAILDSMGWVLFRQGRAQEALGYLQRASELGKDPEIDLHKGEVQWSMGDQAGARQTWQTALDRAPDNDKLKERLRRAGP